MQLGEKDKRLACLHYTLFVLLSFVLGNEVCTFVHLTSRPLAESLIWSIGAVAVILLSTFLVIVRCQLQ